jgi:hypothetical protein
MQNDSLISCPFIFLLFSCGNSQQQIESEADTTIEEITTEKKHLL